MDRVLAKPLELHALVRVLSGWWSSSPASDVWPVIAGLDPVNTKLRFGSDRSLFTWALRRVCHENADLENSVLPLSGIALLKRLHKLCGSAGAIGATALSDAARDAHAVLEQDELAGTRIVVDRVGPEIRRLRESAAAFWTQPPSSAIEHTAPVDSEAYDELASLLARHCIDALSAFARVAPGLRAQLGPEDFAVLERAIDALDYDGALELLHATVFPQCARADR
jgi:HPt (histidine-containing phosphotransfer) domain-containing protein